MQLPEKLKIALIIDSYDEAVNGAVVSTRRLVELLRKEHEIKIVTNGESFEDHVGLPRLNIPIINTRMKKMGFAFAKPDTQILHTIIQWADIIHIQFPFPLGRAAMKTARELDKPVTTSFDVQPETMLLNMGFLSGRISGILYRSLIKSFYNKSMQVICPSDFAASELEERKVKTETTVIPAGVSPEYTPAFWQNHDKRHKTFTLLTVGRHALDKNQEILIEAVKLSKYRDQINLIISGRGPLTGYLRSKARDLPNSAVIDFLPSRILLQAFQESDLYVHTAKTDLKSMAVIEAMACGLPPLIANSPLSAAPGYAINNLFLFKSNCMKDLAGQIDFWYEHRHELEAYRYRYSQEAMKFRIETSHRKLVTLYRSIIAGHRLQKNFSTLKGSKGELEEKYLQA